MLVERKFRLLENLVESEVAAWVEAIARCCEFGFSVRVDCESNWVKQPLLSLMRTRLQASQAIVTDDLHAFQKFSICNSKQPIILVGLTGEGAVTNGLGLVVVRMPSFSKLTPRFPKLVSQILEEFGLGKYCDIIDGGRVAKLRRIYESTNLDYLIDTVVGLLQADLVPSPDQGDVGGELFLQQRLQGFAKEKYETAASKANLPPGIFTVLDWVLERQEDPQNFMKVLLTSYCFEREHENVTRAVKILKISRSSLYSHIAAASELGIAAFFSKPDKENALAKRAVLFSGKTDGNR
jgi:hypothetical protein